MANEDTGHGATLTMATTGFAALVNIKRIGPTTQELPVVDDTHLGTSSFQTNRPGDLPTPGEFEVEFQYNVNEQPALGTIETITVTTPLAASGQSVAAKWAGTGYVKSRTLPEFVTNELMMGSMVIQWNGKTGPTFTDFVT